MATSKDRTFKEKLIDEVRRHMHLLYPGDYRTFKVTWRSWIVIATKLGKDENICSKVWKNLRVQYNRANKTGTIISPNSILAKMESLFQHAKQSTSRSMDPRGKKLGQMKKKEPSTQPIDKSAHYGRKYVSEDSRDEKCIKQPRMSSSSNTLTENYEHTKISKSVSAKYSGTGGNQPGPVFSTSRNANVANNGGLLNAPQLTNCNFNAPVTFSNEMGERKEDANVDSACVFDRILDVVKKRLEKQVGYIVEGNETRLKKKPLNKIYTKVYITEGEASVVNEHEICQIDSAAKAQPNGKEIEYNDIFKQDEAIRTVLTKGNAGIGKTVIVHKFILDWVEGKANRDIKLMLLLPFREISLLTGEYSFLTLLIELHPELAELKDPEIYNSSETVFILDGLDESRFQLDFSKKLVADMNQPTTVDVLITSLIKGKLMDSALLWITSRPAAVTQVLFEHIDQVTEVRGFNDPQKEEYFHNSISNTAHAESIYSHIKSSRVLHIMCHIPLFCWIAATVFQNMLSRGDYKEIPKTLTSMYCYFLLIQADRTHQKNHGKYERNRQKLLKCNREVILKVAQLAFKQLLKARLIFSEEDLKECGIDANDSLVSGICTEILKVEPTCYVNTFHKKIYCFVHLSIQEFLAAFYAFHCYISKNLNPIMTFLAQRTKAVPEPLGLEDFLKIAVNKALDSKNGHLDLFVRFLHGISLETNQRLLGGLLPNVESDSETMRKIIGNLKKMQRKNISAERCMNLFHCLSEMNDCSVREEVQGFLNAEKGSVKVLSTAHCSALAYMLQFSDEVQEVFDLRKYNTSDEGRKRLVPAVKSCSKAILVGCKLSESSCDIVASALQSVNSALRELDLSDNDLQDSGVKILCAGLKSTNCKLEKLRLSCCGVTRIGCEALASALCSNSSYLKELDLSRNYPGVEGRAKLSKMQKKQRCTISFDEEAEYWLKSGLRKYACKITLNPNTAHRKLSWKNQKVNVHESDQERPDCPERFKHCQQFLCSEKLTGKAYWEIEWNGRASIGVAYKSISRDGLDESRLGCNNKSWSLECYVSEYLAKHKNETEHIPAPRSHSGRLGVFLDWQGGTLSFYSVSSGTLSHLHTFHGTFDEPLYPGFEVSKSVTICQPKKPTKRKASDL
ncbi:NLR family CARD domain-containing protein 3-like [Clupea harengus]|uniref:NLR family CARD domain-containing protein 3-like n=1 Tax=Clupea harengus TaxID=7950 RepID=A0A6P8F1M7_CLUHA|nr:NLR family CARD domain-containing protein 3-like [Clupea harengus]